MEIIRRFIQEEDGLSLIELMVILTVLIVILIVSVCVIVFIGACIATMVG
jgi:Flp pilus assembly pilin Flp